MNKDSKKNQELPFSKQEREKMFGYRWHIFQNRTLGKLYNAIPFDKLASLLPKKENPQGAPSWLSRQGMIGLMMLKSKLKLSDEQLIDRLNTDWELQMFCGIQLSDNQMIRDKNLPSRIRIFIGQYINIDAYQKVLAKDWTPYMSDINLNLNDATAYESYIKYPTDEKLLWDCNDMIYSCLFAFYENEGVNRARNDFRRQEKKQLIFNKRRKKTYKQKRRRRKSLLYLLEKGIEMTENAVKQYTTISKKNLLKYYSHLYYIQTIYEQQKYMYDNKTNSVKNRIVSLFKPYIRPIVRGKENKRVEFGMKVQMSQVDNINFIDYLSYSAFNEGKYLKLTILKHNERFGFCSHVGIDRIYGTNANRSYMSSEGILHCLPRKGRAPKDEKEQKKMREIIGRARATRMEGSFGNEKNHYNLRKIKARTEPTEIVWLFFGIMTANAMKISKRLNVGNLEKKQK